MTKNSKAERSKYLSYLLRHKPEAVGLTLDREGWCSILELLEKTDFTYDELVDIVTTDEKQRYEFAPELGSVTALRYEAIRASQGHSTSQVRMTFKTAVPPTVLYHGTVDTTQDVILKQGLKPMNRHHVHLSADLNTAETVGGRRKGGTVVFEVDAKSMVADGIKFFISENGVWLVDAVAPKYLKVHK